MTRAKLRFAYDRGVQAWCLFRAGKRLRTYVGIRKREALRHAVIETMHHAPSQLTVYKMDGRIEEERTFVDDPRRTVG